VSGAAAGAVAAGPAPATTRAVVMAGGRGSRLAPLTETVPKALVPIGGRPILWHLLRSLRGQGIRDMVLALGHQGAALAAFATDSATDPTLAGCTVVAVDTGECSDVAERLVRLAGTLGPAPFLLAWCDGLFDVDLAAVLAFHAGHGRLATIVAVQPPSPYGHLSLDGEAVTGFVEKPVLSGTWINAGLFILDPAAVGWIDRARPAFERGLLPRLAAAGELRAWRHTGFWRCMDTPRDREALEALWATGAAPWGSGKRAC